MQLRKLKVNVGLYHAQFVIDLICVVYSTMLLCRLLLQPCCVMEIFEIDTCWNGGYCTPWKQLLSKEGKQDKDVIVLACV